MGIKCFSDIGTDTGSGTKQLAGQDGFSFAVFISLHTLIMDRANDFDLSSNALDISASLVPYFFTFLSYFLLSKKRPRIIVKSE